MPRTPFDIENKSIMKKIREHAEEGFISLRKTREIAAKKQYEKEMQQMKRNIRIVISDQDVLEMQNVDGEEYTQRISEANEQTSPRDRVNIGSSSSSTSPQDLWQTQSNTNNEYANIEIVDSARTLQEAFLNTFPHLLDDKKTIIVLADKFSDMVCKMMYNNHMNRE